MAGSLLPRALAHETPSPKVLVLKLIFLAVPPSCPSFWHKMSPYFTAQQYPLAGRTQSELRNMGLPRHSERSHALMCAVTLHSVPSIPRVESPVCQRMHNPAVTKKWKGIISSYQITISPHTCKAWLPVVASLCTVWLALSYTWWAEQVLLSALYRCISPKLRN